ncbi:hypothetical protein IMG5_073140 [Ichthyophthirius multifiliis]|uniref:Tubby C-terminal domain-containing protein n=1 Tax=Ichthyophthirius multifiliis TaxID=5932 RepID=G0QPZ2_ICHMU|nr:hypothetical protein IMG5_073140 [Ichthyophthirius multifiliis]EGR32719.1 hypothetical protein IMG5_073140 [Ichthyophthirius multifiliis]|eukprot:XP_004036705.1 hypothetical protein IMG5_073140 [Ichthyophthirius multifiliis]
MYQNSDSSVENTIKNEEKDKETPQEDQKTQIKSYIQEITFKTSTEDKKRFFYQPIQKGKTIQMTIRRQKGIFGAFQTIYNLYMSYQNQQFLLSAKKRQKHYYMIQMNPNYFSKKSTDYIGKIKGNSSKIQYIIYDNGENPKKCILQEKIREEWGIVQQFYDENKQIQIKFIIPGIQNDYQQYNLKKQSLIEAQNQNKDNFIQLFKKKQPWYDNFQNFVKDYNGRASIGSVKNMQIYMENDLNNIVLQIGKDKENEFNIDVKYPFSIFQAYAIALYQFDFTAQI